MNGLHVNASGKSTIIFAVNTQAIQQPYFPDLLKTSDRGIKHVSNKHWHGGQNSNGSFLNCFKFVVTWQVGHNHCVADVAPSFGS